MALSATSKHAGALLAVLAALVFGASAAVAQAPGALDSFDRICLKSDAATPLARARAEGFVAPPPSYAAAFLDDTPLPGATVLWRTLEGELLVMMAADGPLDGDQDLLSATCGIIVMPAWHGVTESLEAHLSVGVGERQKEGYRMLTFQDETGVRKPVDPSKALTMGRLIDAGKLHWVMYGVQKDRKSGDMTMMLVVTPRPK